MRKSGKWDRRYLYLGLTLFAVIAAAILLYFILNNIPEIRAFFSKLGTILAPFIWGLMISFILHPLMEKLCQKLPKWLSVLICILLVLIVLFALISLIIPQLYQSMQTIIVNSPMYFDKVRGAIGNLLEDNPQLEATITSVAGELNENVTDLIKTRIMPSIQSILTNVTTGVYSFVVGVVNLLIGVIVAAYILANLEKISSGTRMILYSVFTIPVAEKIRESLRFIDKTFMNFLSGKLLDSLIIGIICYIFCVIVDMPYALLVSVIVGVTNIIPFFGPLLGAVPSAFIILLVDPLKCLVFVIFIIILQQIDGNIIGPKILGSSIGINGFWVMFAIIVGGGLFGFWGMVFGVPTFVCIYGGLKSLIVKKLIRSELPSKRIAYMHLDHIDPETGEAVQRELSSAGEDGTSCSDDTAP